MTKDIYKENNGGFKINNIEFDEMEFAVLQAVFGSVSDGQTLAYINKRIELESKFDSTSEVVDILRDAIDKYKNNNEFFYNLYEKFKTAEVKEID